jgi:hypothetical protein
MNRSKEFHGRLKHIGFQVDRLANCISIDTLTTESTRDQFHRKSNELMTTILSLLDSYLQHLNQNFFGKFVRVRSDLISQDGKVSRWNGGCR